MALLATLMTLRELRRMVPVQMVSRSGEEQVGATVKRGRGMLLFLGALIALLLPPAASFYVSHHLSQGGLNALSNQQLMVALQLIGSGPLLAIILMLAALTRSGGTIIQWATRVWTHLVPVPSAVWKIARSQAIVRSRGKAFGSTVIVLTACLFLIGGLLAAGQTSTAGVRDIPQLHNLSSASPMELFSSFWAALLITLIGAVASFAISARERNLDLALVAVAGAGPQQLLALSALDGCILMTTGVLIAAAATLVVAAATAIAFLPLSGSFRMVFPWELFLALSVPIILTGSLTTLFSARSTLKKPAITTIQTAIGE